MSLTMSDVLKLLNDKLAEQERKLKKEMSDICTSITNKKIEEVDKKYKKELESQKSVIVDLKVINKELFERIVILEKDMPIAFREIEETQRLAYSTDQYQRRMNVEISGIPHECDDTLEEVVIDLINEMRKGPGEPFEDVADNIDSYDIQGCHRLQSKNKDGVKNTIVRFTNRKICDDIHEYKKNVKDIKIVELGERVKHIYFNENLSKYNKDFAAKCRRLKRKKLIIDTWTSNGIVRIKLNDNTIKVISHQNDLDILFPDFVYYE